MQNGKKKIKLGSIHPTRDFNYIKDIVAGFISALNSDSGSGEVVNFGSNFEISIGETVNLIAEIMSVNIDIISEQNRLRPVNSEVERLCADNTKASKLFGWSPQYSHRKGFKKGLEETIKWFSDPKNLGLYKSNIYNI